MEQAVGSQTQQVIVWSANSAWLSLPSTTVTRCTQVSRRQQEGAARWQPKIAVVALFDYSRLPSPAAHRTMTKKKSSSGSVASVRKEIQRVDRELVKLLGDRARAAQKLAKLRQDDGAALYDLT